MIFTSDDIDFLNSRGISKEEALRQYALLTSGVQFPVLIEGANMNHGIFNFSDFNFDFISLYNEQKSKINIVRFIPASGAATRMFAHLQDYLINHQDSDSTDEFFRYLKLFSFYSLIPIEIQEDKRKVIEFVLSENGLNFSKLPKALIPFHYYRGFSHSAFHSQLAESLEYTIDRDQLSKVHFTISEDFKTLFNSQHAEYLKFSKSEKLPLSVSYSSQLISTDTIALDENQQPVRNSDNKIILRQGGHGSLLKNLNEIDADVVFIRNIDNVVSPGANAEYVKIHCELGGLLLFIKEKIFSIQEKQSEEVDISEEDLNFLQKYFMYHGKNSKEEVKKFVFRPIRVCGMVKNQGEPGGGPFLVKENDGSVSLQIVESSQVNTNDPNQLKIFKSGSFFNPVDIVCCTKDHKGNKYNLTDFSNPDFSFLANKKVSGKHITVLEHPGLWNGSMHHWLTLFVEIPVSVFNPVKTVNDLLRPAHQK